MTSNKNTPAIADVDDPTVDELAAAEAMRTIEDAAAVKVAATFNDAGDKFTRARTIAGAASRGASLERIAARVTELRVRAKFPKHDDDAIAAILADDKGLRKLKLTVSKSSMQQYASTWTTTVDAGVRPTAAVIDAMFSVKSTGGHAKPLAELIESLGESEGEERASKLLEGLPIVLDGLRTANKAGKARNAGGTGSGEGEDESGEGASAKVVSGTVQVGEVTVDGLEGVVALVIEALPGWSEVDRERALAAASDLMAALIGEPVEVEETVAA